MARELLREFLYGDQKWEGTMNTRHNPSTLSPPLSNYVHGTEVSAGKRLLFVSGQVGIAPDGSVPSDFRAQADLAFSNVLEVLKSANMGPDSVVRLTVYAVSGLSREELIAFREARDAALDGVAVAHTLIYVSGLIMPELRLEIECVAAQ